MAIRTVPDVPARARLAAFAKSSSARATVLALAVPPLFLHADWQPSASLEVAGTSVDVRLSDVAVLAVLAAAVAVARRRGLARLRGGRPLWLALGALVAWIAAATLYGPLVLDGYPLAENAVTAAKFAEYLLLAPAVALVVRSEADLRTLAVGMVAWGTVATLFGLAQLLGLDVLDAGDYGRQPSFLGYHDFAALSGAVLVLGLGALVLLARPARRTIAVGAVGLVLAAPLAGILGLALAVGALAVLARALAPYPWRRVAVAGAVALAVAGGALALRADSVTDFFRFLRADEPEAQVETYSQRLLLAYIGWQVFLDHPLAGVGWQGSSEPAAFEPQLDEARGRFPDANPASFPAAGREWGVQSAYVQVPADLGVVGLALLAAVGAAVVSLARRARIAAARGARPTAVLGVVWLLLAAGLWAAQGLVAGLPLSALTAIALGLLAAGAAEDRRAGD